MKRLTSVLVLGLALLAAPAVAAADAPDHLINSSGQSLELDCGDGGKVLVNGSKNEIAITGGCTKVQINGAMNDIEIDGTDKIQINGAGNTVTWTKGYKKAKPKIQKTGRNNRVTQNK